MNRTVHQSQRISRLSVRLLVTVGAIGLCLVASLWQTSPKSRAISLAPQASCVAPPAGMVAWYPGDGNANDISATANNGALQNGATFAAGMVGQAFSFDGVDDRVSVPDAPALDFNSNSPLTIDLWVFRTSTSPAGHLVGKRSGCDLPNINYQLAYDNRSGSGLVIGGANASQVNTGRDLPLNTWTHLAGTFDGTTFRLYINGELAGSANGSLGPPNDAPLTIGNSGTCEAFGGLIDEVEILNRALSQSEIQALFNAGSAGKCKTPSSCAQPPSNMVSWWPGDGNANDIQDGNQGTLQNGATFDAGRVGQGFKFDGTTNGQGVLIGNPANLQLQDFTIDAWISRSSTSVAGNGPGNDGAIVAYGHDGYAVGMLSDGRVFLSKVDIDIVDSGTMRVTDSNFHHVAVTKSGSSVVFYIDGVAGSPVTHNSTFAFTKNLSIGARLDLSSPSTTTQTSTFAGRIDEVEIFNRALSASEVQAIFNAGSAGKCKTCAQPPAGMAAWYPLEGSGLDHSGNNLHAALSGAYTFGPGKVNQGWQVTDAGARTPDAAALRPSAAVSVEAWVKANASPGTYRYLLSKSYDGNSGSYALYTGASGGLHFYVRLNSAAFGYALSPDAGTRVWDGQFHHVVGAYDGSSVRLFVDGVEQGGSGTPASGPILYGSSFENGDLFLGRFSDPQTQTPVPLNFNGTIDEATVYNRGLSPAEIQSLASAGGAGKCASGPAPTPTPTPIPTPTPNPTPTPTPAPTLVAISGRVTDSDGKGIVNVTMTLTGQGTGCRYFLNGVCSVLTDDEGFYAFRQLTPSAGNTITVTPQKTGMTFQPGSLTFNNVSSDQTANFTRATAPTFTISGRVTLGFTGIGVRGVIVKLLGIATGQPNLALSAVTDTSGGYSFPNLPAGRDYFVEEEAGFLKQNGYRPNPGNCGGGSGAGCYFFKGLNRDEVVNINFRFVGGPPPGTRGRIAFLDYNLNLYAINDDGTREIGLLNGPVQNPTLSRDGTQIAFTVGGQLWVINYDGSGRRRINLPFSVSHPTWNRDGAKLAFVGPCNQGGVQCINTIRQDGTDHRIITDHDNTLRDFAPDWSPASVPDGTGGFNKDGPILFTRNHPSGNSIYIVDSDGANLARVTTGGNNDRAPSWNSEGNTFAFLGRTLGGETYRGYLYLAPANVRNIDTSALPPSTEAHSKAAWQPRGNKLAFEFPVTGSATSGAAPGIWILDRGQRTRFLPNAIARQPSWGPEVFLLTNPNTPSNATDKFINQTDASVTTVSSGNVTINFSSVQAAGATAINPVSPASVLPLPAGYASISSAGLAYDIETAAQVSPPITTCIKVPSLNDEAVFNSLRILHYENDALVDRTILAPASPAPDYTTRTLCAGTTSLGTFVVVQKVEASLPVIDGLVTDASGNPLGDVIVELRGDRVLATQTDINGRFRFSNLVPGGNYAVVPLPRGEFSFAPKNGTFTNIQTDQTVAFSATACGVNLPSQSVSVGAAGGERSVTVNAAAGDCGWTAFTNDLWITLLSGPGGSATQIVNGSGTVTVHFRVEANSGVPRVGTITVAGQTFKVTQDGPVPATNPIDDPTIFVPQHYFDFLNRAPDQAGLNFWVNQTTNCSNPPPADLLVCRINVSASFFLSIEFQQTGYLVERSYKTAYGDATGNSTFGSAHQLPVPIVRFNEFLTDTQEITKGVIVLQQGWEQQLESNKQAFFLEFVQRLRFTTAFPTSMTPAELVDKLNQNAGNVLSASERTSAINLFGGAANTTNPTARAQALRQVAEDPDLLAAEFNRAFVLMQYFGYLRRNPNDAPEQTLDYTGYDFWLTKLNQFNGNYINAEMVKAFLSSIEYRQRFGP